MSQFCKRPTYCRRPIKLFLGIVFLSFAGNVVFAGNITGIILDQFGQPVYGVAVTVVGKNTGEITGYNGTFTLHNLPEGIYTIHLSHLNYYSKTIREVVVGKEKSYFLDPVKLDMKVYKNDELIYTANRSDTPLHRIPATVNLVSREDLKERQVGNAAEVLREETGVLIQKTGHGGGSPYIRGLNANRVLLLVDGLRLNNSIYRTGNLPYLSWIDPNMLERIEIVRGPSSVLYGTDAMGGAVNMITQGQSINVENPENNVTVNSRYSSADDERMFAVMDQYTTRNLAVTVSGMVRETSDLRRGENTRNDIFERTDDAVQENSGFKEEGFHFRYNYRMNGGVQQTGGIIYHRRHEVPRYDKYENSGFYKWLYEPQELIRIYNISSGDWGFFPGSYQVGLSFQQHNEGRIKQRDSDDPIDFEDESINTYGVSIKGEYFHNSHRIIYGLEEYYDAIGAGAHTIGLDGLTSAQRARYPDNSNYLSSGIFLQDEITLSPNARMIAGLRFSDFRATFSDTTQLLGDIEEQYDALIFSLGTILNLNSTFDLRGNLSQGFRAPNIADLSKLGESKGEVFEVPNADLDPEKSISLDVGVRVHTHRLNSDFSIFASRITGLIESAPDLLYGSPTVLVNDAELTVKSKQNIGDAWIYGTEAGGNYKLTERFLLKANTMFTYGENTTSNEPVGGIPPFMGRLGLKWQQKVYDVELYVRFAAKQDRLSADDKDDSRIPEGGTPAWTTYNIRSSWKFAEWMSIRLGVENFTDLNYREHGSGINAPCRNFVLAVQLYH